MTAEEIISYAELSIQSIELDNGKDTIAYDFYKSVLKILQADPCKTCQKVKTTFKQTANEWGVTCEPIAEPCEDTVSRQAAIKAIWDGINMDIYTSEVKEILEGLPPVQPKSKWIPVGKKLPEDGESVLMSYVLHGYFNLYIEVGVYTEGKFLRFGENDLVKIFDVKAWMPLPEPYKAERKDKEC